MWLVLAHVKLCMNFSLLQNTMKTFWRMLVTRQLTVAIDFQSRGKNTMEFTSYQHSGVDELNTGVVFCILWFTVCLDVLKLSESFLPQPALIFISL